MTSTSMKASHDVPKANHHSNRLFFTKEVTLTKLFSKQSVNIRSQADTRNNHVLIESSDTNYSPISFRTQVKLAVDGDNRLACAECDERGWPRQKLRAVRTQKSIRIEFFRSLPQSGIMMNGPDIGQQRCSSGNVKSAYFRVSLHSARS